MVSSPPTVENINPEILTLKIPTVIQNLEITVKMVISGPE